MLLLRYATALQTYTFLSPYTEPNADTSWIFSYIPFRPCLLFRSWRGMVSRPSLSVLARMVIGIFVRIVVVFGIVVRILIGIVTRIVIRVIIKIIVFIVVIVSSALV